MLFQEISQAAADIGFLVLEVDPVLGVLDIFLPI